MESVEATFNNNTKSNYTSLFSDINDFRQCQTIQNTLQSIYCHYPPIIIQRIAEFATGIIVKCDEKLCDGEILSLHADRKNLEMHSFCDTCKSKFIVCNFSMTVRNRQSGQYKEIKCNKQFPAKSCACGMYNIWKCTDHRSYCKICADAYCGHVTCIKHRLVQCISCKIEVCEAKENGNWCTDCGYVCKDCIEYSCKCTDVYVSLCYRLKSKCIKHQYCESNHMDHLGFCDCSKQCAQKLCCCQDQKVNVGDLEYELQSYKCLQCDKTKKYYSQHLPQRKQFVCASKNDTTHFCGHGICLDCTANFDQKESVISDECTFCICGEECCHSKEHLH
eukprot:189372_1